MNVRLNWGSDEIPQTGSPLQAHLLSRSPLCVKSRTLGICPLSELSSPLRKLSEALRDMAGDRAWGLCSHPKSGWRWDSRRHHEDQSCPRLQRSKAGSLKELAQHEIKGQIKQDKIISSRPKALQLGVLLLAARYNVNR